MATIDEYVRNEMHYSDEYDAFYAPKRLFEPGETLFLAFGVGLYK